MPRDPRVDPQPADRVKGMRVLLHRLGQERAWEQRVAWGDSIAAAIRALKEEATRT